MLEYNRNSITFPKRFGSWTFTEGGSDNDSLDLTRDLQAMLLTLELDITIANAAGPYNHGLAEIIKKITVDIDGSDTRVNIDGFGALLHSVMYTRNRPSNFIHGATGANQILRCDIMLPTQISADRGDSVNLTIDWDTELVLDDTAANITINSGVFEANGIFGDISDESYLVKGAKSIANTDDETRISGKNKFLEQMAFYGTKELAANLYDVIDQCIAMIGSKNVFNMRKQSMAGWGYHTAAPLIAADPYLVADYVPFLQDYISRALLVPTPTTLIDSDILLLLDRAAADTVNYSALLSRPVVAKGEDKVVTKAEKTSTGKTPVT